ncbi:MAG TPA: LysR family transcriptional regulator [Erysipelotrichaceae bacterium]|nr:LysR family transcriptional regulator [Erysipelotrichaceae bacterium]HQB32983.1 LysR family transcriptional regulator [Erysipelotrichaceae bacterium]
MDSRKLEILLKAVEAGSFSKASEVVDYTQSGLTHLMDSLEKEVGFKLLKRSHNGIRLTEKGKELLPAIREFLQANANLENKIKEISHNENEVVRIAVYASMAMHWIPEILYRFKRICPAVNVDVRMVDHALEPFELLEKGQTDLIFASTQDFNFCNWIPLYKETLYAILPKDYPLKDADSFPITEFSGKDFLMPYGRFDIDVNRAFEPMGVQANIKSFLIDDETLIRMVSKKLGLSMMSELMIRGRTDDVLCVPISPPSYRELGMATHIKRKDTVTIKKLKDCVLKYISEITR